MKRTTRRTEHTAARVSAAAVLAVALLSSLLVPLAVADAPDITYDAAVRLIELVAERYESEPTCRITFTQETYWALADTTVSVAGTLLLERPSHLSVSYEDGSAVVSDGDSLWVYAAATGQFFATEVAEEDVVIDPARLLRQYVPAPDDPLTDAGNPGGSDRKTLHMVPATPTQEPARLEVTVDPKALLVTGIVARSRSGDFTTYRIKDTRFGVPTDASDFTLTLPPGAERLGGTGASAH